MKCILSLPPKNRPSLEKNYTYYREFKCLYWNTGLAILRLLLYLLYLQGFLYMVMNIFQVNQRIKCGMHIIFLLI